MMTCNDIDRILSDAPKVRAGALGLEVQRHTDDCHECATAMAETARVESMAHAWRNAAPSDALRERVVTAAAHGPIRTRTVPIWAALAAAAVIALIAVTTFVPVGPSATGLAANMALQMSRVQNAVVSYWATDYTTQEDGRQVAHHFTSLHLVEQQWYENHKWRKEGVYGSRLIIGYEHVRPDGSVGVYYRYDAAKHRVISMTEMGPQIEVFTLRGLIGSDATSMPSRILGHEEMNGRTVYILEMVGSRERYICWVDAVTKLARRIDLQTRSAGGWTTSERYLLRYNQNLSPALFEQRTLKDEGWTPRQMQQVPAPGSAAATSGGAAP